MVWLVERLPPGRSTVGQLPLVVRLLQERGRTDARRAHAMRRGGARGRRIPGPHACDSAPLQHGLGPMGPVGTISRAALAVAFVSVACGASRLTAIGGGWFVDE